MAAHRYMRFTADIDILVTPDGLEAADACLGAAGYTRVGRKRWRDEVTGIPVDLFTGSVPSAVSVEIDGIPVVRLEKLIDYKLAAGMANPQRLHDLADVQRLIEGLKLPLDFADQLEPATRDKYIEYWHAIQNATGPDRE